MGVDIRDEIMGPFIGGEDGAADARGGVDPGGAADVDVLRQIISFG